MFSPDQVQSWNRSVNSETGLREAFAGKTLRRYVVPFSSPDNQPDLERTVLGRLRAPARVFGKPFDPSCMRGIGDWDVAARLPRCRHLRQAVILGNSAVLTEAYDLLTPFRCNSLTADAFVTQNAFGHQGFLVEEVAGSNVAIYCQDQRVPAFSSSQALFLYNIEPGNYGSFFFRVLPQLLYLQENPMEFDYYIVPERTSFLIEALSLLGLPEKPLVEVKEIAGQLLNDVIMICIDDAEGFIDPATRRGLAGLADRMLRHSPSRPVGNRFYVSRRLSALRRPWYRVIQNESDLEDIATKAGLTVIYPETLTLKQQLTQFAGGALFVGPSGSGMFNVGFATCPRRVLDIETHHVTVRQHAKFYASLGCTYSYLFADLISPDAPNPTIAPSRCNIELFEKGLEWLQSG